MNPKIYIIKQKPNISKISAATLKEIGFKSKAIAKNFAKLSDVNPKNFNDESSLLKALKNKLENFKKLGLEFNDVVKKINTATPKIKQNREIKLEKKVLVLKNKVDKFIEDRKQSKIKPYQIEPNGNNDLSYRFFINPTAKLLNEVSEHYLQYKNFRLPTNKDYIPLEQTAHSRKLVISYTFNGDIAILNKYLQDVFNNQKHTLKYPCNSLFY